MSGSLAVKHAPNSLFIEADVAFTAFLGLLLWLSWWYSGDMLERIISVSIVLAIVVLAAMLQVSTPTTAGPLGILIVFIFMYVLVLGVLTFALFGASRLSVKLLQIASPKKQRRPLSLVRSYYFSSVVALAPVIFIGMQSVGEVGFYDVLLVTLFVGVACFYIAKRTA